MNQSTSALKRTPLFNLHQQLGARMVPFAGYEMPVQYPAGIKTEHLFCRESAGLFDVSHMGQVVIEGTGAQQSLERLIPIDLAELSTHQQSYGFFTHEDGGIIDDLIITRWGEEKFFLVINAACKDSDLAHLKKNLSSTVNIRVLQDQALMALQGPIAFEVLVRICSEISDLVFMQGCESVYSGKQVYITRSGYTGEDGFEISCPADIAAELAEELLSCDQVAPIGLGARDSLRLEAGLCLYGHDLTTSTTPVEAGLVWAMSKSRRDGGSKEAGFLGADIILEQIKQGAAYKRVGLDIEGRAPVRESAMIEDSEGNEIGRVCSGGFGPSVGKPVAMAYIKSEFCEPGTAVNAIVRDKARPAKICKLPYLNPNYFRG